jgi:hypothetical protein
MATVIGIPVDLLTLFAFPLLILVAWTVAALTVVDWPFNRGPPSTHSEGRLLLLLADLS